MVDCLGGSYMMLKSFNNSDNFFDRVEQLIEDNRIDYLSKANVLISGEKVTAWTFGLLVCYELRDAYAVLKISHDEGKTFLTLFELYVGSKFDQPREALVQFFGQSEARIQKDYS